MEKRISFFQFQSVKNVAKAIDPKLKEKAKLQKKALLLKQELEAKQQKLQKEIEEKTGKMEQEFNNCQTQINLLEAGIVQTLGFHVADLVKKVMEPTGKTDPDTGKEITVTKYVPTSIVSYDGNTKEFVISVPDKEEPECPAPVDSEEEAPAEDNGDVVTEASESEEENKADDMPW